jgi:hypothetical protein
LGRLIYAGVWTLGDAVTLGLALAVGLAEAVELGDAGVAGFREGAGLGALDD